METTTPPHTTYGPGGAKATETTPLVERVSRAGTVATMSAADMDEYRNALNALCDLIQSLVDDNDDHILDTFPLAIVDDTGHPAWVDHSLRDLPAWDRNSLPGAILVTSMVTGTVTVLGDHDGLWEPEGYVRDLEYRCNPEGF